MRQAGKIRFLLRAWDTRHGFNKWTHRSNTVSKPLTWDWLHCNQNSKQDIHRGNKCAAPVRKTLRELGEPGPGNGNPCHVSAHLQGKHHSSRGVTSSDTLHQEFKQLPDSPPTDTADKPGTSSQDHRSKNLFPFLSYFYDQGMNIQEGKNKAKKKKKLKKKSLWHSYWIGCVCFFSSLSQTQQLFIGKVKAHGHAQNFPSHLGGQQIPVTQFRNLAANLPLIYKKIKNRYTDQYIPMQ